MRNASDNNIMTQILTLIFIEINARNSCLLKIIGTSSLSSIHIKFIKRKSLWGRVILIWIICHNCWSVSNLYIPVNCPASEYSSPPDAATNDAHYDSANNREKSCDDLANIERWTNSLVILLNRNLIIITILIIENQHVSSVGFKWVRIIIIHWAKIFVVYVIVWTWGVITHVSYKKLPICFIFSFIFYSVCIYILLIYSRVNFSFIIINN